MPELPEVEVVRQGIGPFILDQTITDVIIRHPRLRFDIPSHLKTSLVGQPVQALARRGKYLLFTLPTGTLLWHLGMSGKLRILKNAPPVQKHDHVDLIFENDCILRFNDPRRFGALLWTDKNPGEHPLLANLGPEPLSADFHADYLAAKAKTRTVAIKAFLMNSKIVVGVGNIYATEALFAARIHPLTPAKQLHPAQIKKLCTTIQKILSKAIAQGGTTLKDFLKSDGKPGYFKQQLLAYGRTGLPCRRCRTKLQELRLAQRSSVFCPNCQQTVTWNQPPLYNRHRPP